MLFSSANDPDLQGLRIDICTLVILESTLNMWKRYCSSAGHHHPHNNCNDHYPYHLSPPLTNQDAYLQGKYFSLMKRAMQFSRLGTRPRFFAYWTSRRIKKWFCMHSKSFGYVDITKKSGHLVECVALHRFKGPSTLAGGGSRGQRKAEFLDFWFLKYFFHLVLLEFHLQVESENWELGSSQPS